MHISSALHIHSLRTWLLLAGWCGMVQSTVCQPEILRFDRLSSEEGLPNNQFRQIIQDRDGILWMVGNDGMARYDGYTIVSFRHSHVDSTTISGNNISTIYEDTKGRLWIGITGGGLNISNTSKSSFRRVRVLENQKEITKLTILDITEDSTGHIWLATDFGLIEVSENENEFSTKSFRETSGALAEANALATAFCLYTDKKGEIWIGTSTGLYCFNRAQKHLYGPGDFKGLPATLIQDIVCDREGKIWVSCQNKGPRMYYTDSNSFQFTPFDRIPFRTPTRDVFFTFDLDNRLWVAEFVEQAFAYDFRDSILFFQSTVNSDFGHERFFRRPFVDYSGSIWLPVEGFYIYRYPKGFHSYRHPYNFHQSNTCIYGLDQDLWLGYREKGLVRLDRTTGQTIHYSKTGVKDTSIPVDHIQDVLKVRSGNLILVGFANVAVMDPKGRVIFSHSVNGTLRAAFEDSKGRIWIGGYSGLHLFSEQKGVIKTYVPPDYEKGEGHVIQTVLEDARGNIWFASDIRGLCMLDPQSEKVTQFLPVEGDPNSLPSITVLDMAIDAHQILWLGTDVALVRFDPVSFSIKSYDKSDGLQNDFIAAVICTHDGRIWMSTHSGLSSFDPVKERFTNYSTADGLSNAGYYNRSKYLDERGMLFFGGKNGVDYFHPDQLRNNPTAPRMFLSGVTVNVRQKLNPDDLEKTNEGLNLTYKDEVLEIEMIGIHFSEQEEVRYMYQMEGMSEEWIDLGTQRKVLFSGLRPGDYMFRARAVSGDQVWSEKDLVLPIYIKPPFYQTAWFQITGFFLLLISLFSVIKWRERSIKNKEKKEAEVNRKIAELEKRALQAQMNPHFIYNSMNSIQQFMIIHDIEGAMKYLTKFSRILRTVLNISAQSRIPLADEIKLIEDYLELENMRFPNKFTYVIHVSPDINIHTVEIPPFFIQPQVENAIRHGLLKKTTHGHLRIEINTEGSHLNIIVEDDGVGRDAARSAKYQGAIVNESKGLAIVEERLSHLHADNGFKPFKIIDLYDTENRPAGTRVEIRLPLE